MEEEIAKTENKFADSAATVSRGFIDIVYNKATTPKTQVDLGKSILKVVWFSIWWPPYLWMSRKINWFSHIANLRGKISAYKSYRLFGGHTKSMTWEEFEKSKHIRFLTKVDNILGKIM